MLSGRAVLSSTEIGCATVTWFSVRCIFKRRDAPQYEERITLLQAGSFEEAIRRAEAEAMEYQESGDFEYLGLAQAYDLRAEEVTNGSEVFSLIRTSPLAPDDYLRAFFDTGLEAQGKIET